MGLIRHAVNPVQVPETTQSRKFKHVFWLTARYKSTNRYSIIAYVHGSYNRYLISTIDVWRPRVSVQYIWFKSFYPHFRSKWDISHLSMILIFLTSFFFNYLGPRFVNGIIYFILMRFPSCICISLSDTFRLIICFQLFRYTCIQILW